MPATTQRALYSLFQLTLMYHMIGKFFYPLLQIRKLMLRGNKYFAKVTRPIEPRLKAGSLPLDYVWTCALFCAIGLKDCNPDTTLLGFWQTRGWWSGELCSPPPGAALSEVQSPEAPSSDSSLSCFLLRGKNVVGHQTLELILPRCYWIGGTV